MSRADEAGTARAAAGGLLVAQQLATMLLANACHRPQAHLAVYRDYAHVVEPEVLELLVTGLRSGWPAGEVSRRSRDPEGLVRGRLRWFGGGPVNVGYWH
jgi:hypothetical protein